MTKRNHDGTEKQKSADVFSVCEEILSDSKLFEEDIKKFEDRFKDKRRDVKEDLPSNSPLLLYQAILTHDLKRVEELLKHLEIWISLRTDNNVHNSTPLFWACKLGFIDIIECLLKNGADPKQFNRIHNTPLGYAVAKGDPAVLKVLFEKCPDILDLGVKSLISPIVAGPLYGTTKLLIPIFRHLLLRKNEKLLLQFGMMLLASGFKSMEPLTKVISDNLNNPFLYAFCEREQSLFLNYLMTLIDNGGDDELLELIFKNKLLKPIINSDIQLMKDKDRLVCAVTSNQVRFLEILFHEYSEFLEEKNWETPPPLEYAAQYGNYTMLELFLRNKPMRIDYKDVFGSNLAHFAAGSNSPDVLEYLYDRKPGLFREKDKKGFTFIYIASKNQNLDNLHWALKKIPSAFLDFNFLSPAIHSGENLIPVIRFFHENFPYYFGRLELLFCTKSGFDRSIKEKKWGWNTGDVFLLTEEKEGTQKFYLYGPISKGASEYKLSELDITSEDCAELKFTDNPQFVYGSDVSIKIYKEVAQKDLSHFLKGGLLEFSDLKETQCADFFAYMRIFSMSLPVWVSPNLDEERLKIVFNFMSLYLHFLYPPRQSGRVYIPCDESIKLVLSYAADNPVEEIVSYALYTKEIRFKLMISSLGENARTQLAALPKEIRSEEKGVEILKDQELHYYCQESAQKIVEKASELIIKAGYPRNGLLDLWEENTKADFEGEFKRDSRILPSYHQYDAVATAIFSLWQENEKHLQAQPLIPSVTVEVSAFAPQ